MKPKVKVKQIEVKPVVRKTVYLQDVDASNFISFAQTLSTDSLITDETLEQQEQDND